MISKEKGKDTASQKKLWDSILEESKIGNSYRNSNLVLIGNKNAGKRTFVNGLQSRLFQQQNNPKMGTKGHSSALEYSFLDVKNPEDPDSDVIARINVWVLDDPEQKDLLVHCINQENLANTIICIFLDCEEPWGMMQSLNDWMGVVSERLGKLLTELPLTKQDEVREKLADYVKTYEEPSYDEEGHLKRRRTSVVPDEAETRREKARIPLPHGVLTVNYGVPIMLVCNKADLIDDYEKDRIGDEKLDFLNYTLRNYALPYAATLLYVSAKQNLNLDIFYEYLVHRFYDFGFKHKAEPVHKDSIFIPSGYDNSKLLNETFKSVKGDQPFEDVITPPVNAKNQKKEDPLGEDLQTFLQRIKEKIPATTQKPTGTHQRNTSMESANTVTANPTTTATSDKSTANFYQSLLQNGTGPNAGGGLPTNTQRASEKALTYKPKPSEIIVEETKSKDPGQPLQPTPKTNAPTSAKSGDPLRAFMESVKTPKGKGLITPKEKPAQGNATEKLFNLFKSENNKDPK